MLEKEDLVAIRGIMTEVMGEMLEDIVLPRFDALETDVAELKTDVAELKTDVAELKTDVAGLKTDMVSVNGKLADMVTIDYMENRLFAQKDELANSGIHAIGKVKTLATELHRNGVISVDQFVLVTAP